MLCHSQTALNCIFVHISNIRYWWKSKLNPNHISFFCVWKLRNICLNNLNIYLVYEGKSKYDIIIKIGLYIRNLKNAHLTLIFWLHNIHLVFSTCPHKYEWILCTETLVLNASFEDLYTVNALLNTDFQMIIIIRILYLV